MPERFRYMLPTSSLLCTDKHNTFNTHYTYTGINRPAVKKIILPSIGLFLSIFLPFCGHWELKFPTSSNQKNVGTTYFLFFIILKILNIPQTKYNPSHTFQVKRKNWEFYPDI